MFVIRSEPKPSEPKLHHITATAPAKFIEDVWLAIKQGYSPDLNHNLDHSLKILYKNI
jgi:hypothetical protein